LGGFILETHPWLFSIAFRGVSGFGWGLDQLLENKMNNSQGVTLNWWVC